MKTSIQWRNPYDADENAYFDEITQIDFTGDPGMTMQAPAEEQDINIIMKRFGVKDGSRLPYWQDANAMYGDFSNIPHDPVEVAETIRLGNNAFAALPADIRRNFESGGHLYNWLQDPKNKDKATDLGLLARPIPKTPAAPAAPLVSTSTSSDKEPLVPTPQPSTGEPK
jgi:hypothetical protein